MKVHTLLNYEGQLPKYIHVSDGKMGDNTAAYKMDVEPGSVTIMDRYYNDFSLLNIWDSKEAFFVVRQKSNIAYKVVEMRELPPDAPESLQKDKIIELTGYKSKKKYPGKLGRVVSQHEKDG